MNPGDSLDGRYTIIDRLGAGGMGEVYKATHTMLGSTRVIKIVRPQIAGSTDAQERFLREARAATKIHHPHVATLHDFASLPDGSHYMVWEYIDGENLAQRLRKMGTLPPRQALRITIQALRGLEAVHRAGIVHRDISPENLMITKDDEVKIIDLGVAKVEDTEVAQTRTGIFVGKLRYASPEQLGFLGENERIDGRADLYSLAMVLVELLTGRPPYEAKSPHEYFILHARDVQTMTIELPRGLPGRDALQSVLDKALARDRNQRYASARDFAAALEDVDRNLPEQRDLPTVATPIDGDETMRVPPSHADTLHRETVRTAAGAAQTAAEVTIKTPLPSPMAGPTMAATLASGVHLPPPPAPPPPAVPQGIAAMPQPVKRRSNATAIIVILIVLLLLGGTVAGGVYYAWPKLSQTFLAKTDTTETTASTATTTPVATTTAPATTETAPPQTASSSLDVTEPLVVEEPPTLSTTSAAPPVKSETIAPPVKTKKATPPPATDTLAGAAAPGGDEPVAIDDEDTTQTIDRNWRPGQRRDVSWRRELVNTRTVALRAGGSQLEMTRALRRHFPNIQFRAYADVTIRYDRHRGTGTVSKGGRVLYVSEAGSADEFARELADIFRGE